MSPWQDDEARDLVAKAARHEPPVSPFAEARVWQRLRRAEERERRRPAWSMFAAGLGCAALLVAVVALKGPAREPRPGDEVHARVVDLPEDGQLVLGESTQLAIERRDDKAVELKLERGTLLAHVLPRNGREPFVVKMPHLTARVVGTVFRAVVHEDGSSTLAVGHGSVEVQADDGHAHLVRAGEIWPASARDRPDAHEVSLLSDQEGVTASSFVHAIECPTEPTLALACRVEQANSSDGVRAENALYEAGLIAFRDLHAPERALELWESLQVRFPNGVLAVEAQASIIDALVALHRNDAAMREIERYLRAHPTDLRSSEMHYVLATLERDHDGDCRRASAEIAHLAEPWSTRARHVCVR